jgi:hypothetical protein
MKSEIFYFDNGQEDTLIKIFGEFEVTKKFRILLEVYVPIQFPEKQLMVFVKAPFGYVLHADGFIDHNGSLSLPSLGLSDEKDLKSFFHRLQHSLAPIELMVEVDIAQSIERDVDCSNSFSLCR